jgi:hypothetical protein
MVGQGKDRAQRHCLKQYDFYLGDLLDEVSISKLNMEVKCTPLGKNAHPLLESLNFWHGVCIVSFCGRLAKQVPSIDKEILSTGGFLSP